MGKVVAVGESIGPRFTVLRFLPDGSLDPSFGSGHTVGKGFVETEFRLESAAETAIALPHEQLLVVGNSSQEGGSGQFNLARYRQDGSLDPAFGMGGEMQTHTGIEGGGALAAALQRGSRILVVGYGIDAIHHWQGLLVAYRLNGTVDRGFGREGQVAFGVRGRTRTALTGVAVLPSGKVLLRSHPSPAEWPP
jgi:uncharacterized delta-60 repeat protein